jgi:hypothetical protein
MVIRLSIFLVIAIAAVAQTTGSFSGTFSFGPAYPMGPLVTGAPYSGEEVSENVRVATDGTRFVQKMTVRKVWRDSQGRIRSERMSPAASNQSGRPVVVEISDPVAGFKYTLDPVNKIVHRQAMINPAAGSGNRVATPAPAQPDAQSRPRFANEKIGTKTIDGVTVEGTRMTVTYPVGMMGNDREFSTVSESWMSPELKIQIFSKSNDPRNGENTFRIENLTRTPPDPILFLLPTDYKVVDESGPFTIQWSSPR